MKTISRILACATCALVLFIAAGPAQAASQIQLLLTVTNVPVNGNTLTLNGSTRTWTNTIYTPGTQVALSNTVQQCATNLFSQFATYGVPGPLPVAWSTNTSNQLVFLAAPNAALTFSIVGTWGEGVLSTQALVSGYVVRVPVTMESAQARTNIASGLVAALDYATNGVPEGLNAFSNIVQRGATQTLGNKTVTNSTIQAGVIDGARLTNVFGLVAGVERLTNGYSTNMTLDTPKLTNAVNYGNAFNSAGSGAGSLQLGTASSATNGASVAVGNSAKSYGLGSITIGWLGVSSNSADIVVGANSEALGPSAIVVGTGSKASGVGSFVLGGTSYVTGTNSGAIGRNVTNAQDNTILLGGIQDVVIGGLLSVAGSFTNNAVNITGGTLTNVSGAFSSATLTNGYLKGGTLTNVQIDASSATVTSLVAHAAQITNANIHAASLIATNPAIISGYATNMILNKAFATNLTLVGANTVAAGASLSYGRTDSTSLADGVNYAVAIGSNNFVKFTGTLSTTGEIYGFVGAGASGGGNGQLVIAVNATGQNIVIGNDSGDPTAANRILTPTAGDETVSNLCSVMMIYDTGSSRWRILRSRL